MYRVLYKGFNGDYGLSGDMDLKSAQDYKQKCLSMGYKQVYIIQIIE